MKIIVLGAGLVGAPMALDLAKEKTFEVSVVDKNAANLQKLSGRQSIIRTIQKDLANPQDVKKLVADHDLVISAVPGFMGMRTLQAVTEAGKDVVDIAFSPEDPFILDESAKKHGVTAVVDCGVAPGMSNVLVGHAARQLDEVDDVLIYVGGLPLIRQWPYEYKAVFSPVDVIEEYTRPARYIENNQLVIRPALSDAEYIDFNGVGTLEAFNSDGLRTLAVTIKGRNMKEKTLRYPGHIEKMKILRETGFFSQDEIELNGVKIRPLDFTAKLLFPKWALKEGEGDLTVMKIIVQGRKSGDVKRYTFELLDYYDAQTNIHSMARTTGYTATVMARLLAAKLFSGKGIIPPEFVGQDEKCVQYLLDGLKARGVIYHSTLETMKG